MGQVPPPIPPTLEDLRRREAERPVRELRAAVARARTPRWKRVAAHISLWLWPNQWAMKIVGPPRWHP